MVEIETIAATQRAWQGSAAIGGATAQAAASESLHRCVEAIALLIEDLKSVGYLWASSSHIRSIDLERRVLAIERALGLPIPPVLIAFWQTIGMISLVDLGNYEHVEFWKQHRIVAPRGFCDGLYIDGCTNEWASFVCQDYVDWKQECGPDEMETGFLISLSPDGYHKDNISGGAPYGVFSGRPWTPTWANFEWSGAIRPITAPAGSPDFLAYLRTTILECAGFPGLLGIFAFESMRERLLQNVPLF